MRGIPAHIMKRHYKVFGGAPRMLFPVSREPHSVYNEAIGGVTVSAASMTSNADTGEVLYMSANSSIKLEDWIDSLKCGKGCNVELCHEGADATRRLDSIPPRPKYLALDMGNYCRVDLAVNHNTEVLIKSGDMCKCNIFTFLPKPIKVSVEDMGQVYIVDKLGLFDFIEFKAGNYAAVSMTSHPRYLGNPVLEISLTAGDSTAKLALGESEFLVAPYTTLRFDVGCKFKNEGLAREIDAASIDLEALHRDLKKAYNEYLTCFKKFRKDADNAERNLSKREIA